VFILLKLSLQRPKQPQLPVRFFQRRRLGVHPPCSVLLNTKHFVGVATVVFAFEERHPLFFSYCDFFFALRESKKKQLFSTMFSLSLASSSIFQVSGTL
jgi:hypothetical protein